jgi:hypothetical protein
VGKDTESQTDLASSLSRNRLDSRDAEVPVNRCSLSSRIQRSNGFIFACTPLQGRVGIIEGSHDMLASWSS